MELRVAQTVAANGMPVLQVSGEIDLATVPTFHGALHRLVTDHPAAVVAVDLDGVSALDDTGLGLLLGGAARARDRGGDVVLVCSDERLLARFALTRLDRAMDVRPSLTG
ncbi:MAG: STAS domain-containing protein [Acidimicrobiia bacterium]